MNKKCELCGGVARMYCESDQASLCWDCDHKVHGANFLVAKHTRCLLCSSCQCPTPWKATGPRLGPIVSACDSCVSLENTGGGSSSRNGTDLSENRSQETNRHDYDGDRFGGDDGGAESYDDGEEDGDDDDDDEYTDDDDEEEDDEAENQVVPWAAALQPPVASSSSSVSSSGGGGVEAFPRRGGGCLTAKRNPDLLYSDEEIACSSSPHDSNNYRPSKRSSTDGNGQTHREQRLLSNSIMR
ncbi:PREDICTED: zinc finger protein CONSTANS-LIKE 9 [Tarenaya hassleriana]|uniref:zinc finger protein CONSTANS-LIKE 9 n=1 Tax=Tarenaya hassleriana TaxID=28532 RepID=UPI00053C32AB|nr:PREDICTED: zinc finger protein CONSTANS-LIKE 9 [Tarenaya hassleriana]